MNSKKITLQEAKETFNYLSKGIDPYTKNPLPNSVYLEHLRTKGCFELVDALLCKCIERSVKKNQGPKRRFSISKEQCNQITFPSGNIGVKGIITAVNQRVSDINTLDLTVAVLYNVLIKHGILRKSNGEGRVKTQTTEEAIKYGIITTKCTFQGETYDRIIYTDQAKAYLKDQLYKWFKPKE